MTTGTPDPSFYSPAMLHAERELDARIDHALRLVAESRAARAEFERTDDNALTDDDTNRLAAYVSAHARTDEWQRVLDRIDQGELTWRQVADDITGGTDRDVAAAFQSLSRVPPLDRETLTELAGSLATPADPPADQRTESPGESPADRLAQLGDPDDSDDPDETGPTGTTPPPVPSRRVRRAPVPEDDEQDVFRGVTDPHER